jgi:hypothetical protein
VPFDLVLDEGRGHGEQSKPLGDDEGFHQLEPGSLLRCQWRKRGITVCGPVAVEFGDDAVPDGDERWIGVS